MAIINYIIMIIISVVGMSVLDHDRTSVQTEEWAIYAVMLYAAWKLVQALIRLIQEHEGGI